MNAYLVSADINGVMEALLTAVGQQTDRICDIVVAESQAEAQIMFIEKHCDRMEWVERIIVHPCIVRNVPGPARIVKGDDPLWEYPLFVSLEYQYGPWQKKE